MTDPRNPLITGVTNVAGYRGDDKLPTSYAVNQLFSGEPLGQNVSANNIIKSGTYRFNTTTSNLPSHLVGTSGLLTVMHERPSAPSNANYGSTAANTDYNPSVIRQVAWPDGPNDVTPYTRTKQNGTWGEWQTMGGNLRRVNLNENVIVGNEGLLGEVAQTNVMYYSFGNYTLTLPDPSGYPLATRIGLEQWEGQGAVNASVGGTSYTQATSPAYEADTNGALTNVYIGPQVYQFEIVEKNGSKTWIMDVDNNIVKTIQGIRNDIQMVGTASEKADKDFSEMIGNDFSMPIYAWKNGTTIKYTKTYAPEVGSTVYSNNTASTSAGTVASLVRDSNQLISGIVVSGTTYSRSAADDNKSNTVSGKFAKEVGDRQDGDTALSNRLGTGVNTNNTVTLGTSGTATAQLALVQSLFGTGIATTTDNINRTDLGTTNGGTVTNQLSLIKDLFGTKITKTDSVTALLGAGVTNTTTVTLGTAGTVTAQLSNVSDKLGTGINTTTNSVIQVGNLGSDGTVTRQFEIVKGLLGTGITTAIGANTVLGSAGTVTAQFDKTKTELNTLNDKLGTGIATTPTAITDIDYTNLATTAAGTVTNQLSLVKSLLGTGGATISKTSNVSTLFGDGVTSSNSVTLQLTVLSNRLGTDVTESNSATSQLNTLTNKIGTAHVYGEGAAISSANGKTVTELISNKSPRTKVYLVSSAVDENTNFQDVNSDTYDFASILHRIHPILVVNSTNGFTIKLPGATSYGSGTMCTVEVPAGQKVTISIGSQSETFTNSASGSPTLVLPFEVTMNTSGTLIWQLLVIA